MAYNSYNLDTIRNKRGVIPPAAMKMNGESEAQIRRRERAEGESGETQFFYGPKPVGEVDPKNLRQKKRELIREQRGLKRSGEITKQQFKEAKKEIKKYTDY